MEKYGVCRRCLGSGKSGDCSACDGTGFSGDAMDYVYPAQALKINGRKSERSDKRVSYAALVELAVVSVSKSLSKMGRK